MVSLAKYGVTFWVMLSCFSLHAQFAPAQGIWGSSAMDKDSSAFVAWANSCVLQRGYLDIAFPDSGFVTFGNESAAIGKAGENGFVSLGDGGSAVLSFEHPIYNGNGFDFAVFENGFYAGYPLAFLEFAFVEVSSDGVSFYRFPAVSAVQDTLQIPMSGIDCAQINNLAGKYVFGYGTPFDLEEMKNEVGLDVNHITHIKLIDVVGSIDDAFASYDFFGHKINEPYPTPFPSGGFDLDAVGVIHSTGLSALQEHTTTAKEFVAYTNPVAQNSSITISFSDDFLSKELLLLDIAGRVLKAQNVLNTTLSLNMEGFDSGVYFLQANGMLQKLVVQ